MLTSACRDGIEGGTAVVGTTVYLPCLSGIVAVQAAESPPSLRVLWSSGVGGGPPIVAAGLVWTIGQDGTLYGLDPTTGSVRQQATIGSVANHFPTPSDGEGLLLAPSAERVVAFTASTPNAATTGPVKIPRSAPMRLPSNHSPPTQGAIPPSAIAGIVVGGLVAVGGTVGLFRRRRTNRSD
jgi:hypothetical protein